MNISQKFELIKKSSKRAVSEIIVTLLLIGITMVGGMLVWVTLSGSQQQLSLDTTLDQPAGTARDIILVEYDTRDGANLGGITNLDNTNDDALKNGEYIFLRLRDRENEDFFIERVLVNEKEHVWKTSEVTLSSGTLSPLPSEGEFIVIKKENPTGTENVNLFPISAGADARLVISLENDLDDIGLNKSIRVGIVVEGFEPTNFVISSGGTR